jgi:HD-GYP domain-containing protein (c-di-GMP phosphodiesterase class II)
MPETIVKKISSAQIACLQKFGKRIANLSMQMAVFDPAGNCILHFPESDDGSTDSLAEYLITTDQNNSDHDDKVTNTNGVFAVSLEDEDDVVATLLVDASDTVMKPDQAIIDFCQTNHVDLEDLSEVLNSLLQNSGYTEDILTAFAAEFDEVEKVSQQFEMIGSELARTYEELVLLYNMSTNMKVTQSNATYLQRACDQITQRIAVEGIAIYLEKKDSYGESLLLTAGSGLVLIEQEMVDILQMHLTEELKNNKDALLDSNIDSPFKYSWPDTVKNIIAVPLMGNEKMFGFMVATNIMNKQDFDSNEVKLFSSVANQCAVFVDNGKLFSDMKELFIGSLKALTSSIDAKDQYTRGHSERVAFISRWIAERFSERYPLEEEYIHKVYLAGLLHDIGKIGISETVLCKNGKLDEEELMQIKSHPRIGATILSEIKQMSEVLQGALCHHERADGKGYPEGLVGDEIPLIGKIISLADAFDAMTSRRIYRDAMDIDHAISQIEEGIGTQFDEKTARVFLDSDIKKLWAIIQDGFIESWDYSNFAEYGALAVGALLR